jgi:hypothetical protein
MTKMLRIAEVIIDQHISSLDAFFTFESQQTRITGASADEITNARGSGGCGCHGREIKRPASCRGSEAL